jgi:hypothetical protein
MKIAILGAGIIGKFIFLYLSTNSQPKFIMFTFHQMKNSSFSYCMELTILNDTNIAKAILILI